MKNKARINKIIEKIENKGGSKLIVILRHSDREEISDAKKSFDVPLTDQGKAIARILGNELSKINSYRLYHSDVPRCRNTAKSIAEGIEASQGSVTILGERDYLGGFFIKDFNSVLGLANQVTGLEFMLKWFAGEIEESEIIPFNKATNYLLSSLLNESNENERSEVDIYITHDWNMMLLLYKIFNFQESKLRWPYYLEPIFIDINNSETHLFYEGEKRFLNIDFPRRY